VGPVYPADRIAAAADKGHATNLYVVKHGDGGVAG
jgi:hypothetical protein